MARITDNFVIQRVGDNLVLIDEKTMSETLIPVDAGVRLVAMAAYLTEPNDPAEILDSANAHLWQAGAIK